MALRYLKKNTKTQLTQQINTHTVTRHKTMLNSLLRKCLFFKGINSTWLWVHFSTNRWILVSVFTSMCVC